MGMNIIRNAAITRIKNLIVVDTPKELDNPFDIESNDEELLDNGFAVKWGEGSTARGATRRLSFVQGLIVTLTRALPQRVEDTPAPSTDSLYDVIDKIMTNFPNDTFLDIPNLIRGIPAVRPLAPLLIRGGRFVQIDIIFDVDYVLDIDYTVI